MSAVVVKRTKGRPSRGAGDVGRERLVEAARTVLRRRVSAGLSRKAVADAAGVTPALVSYYFPEPGSLVAAAVRPLIGDRIGQLLSIIEDQGPWHDRLVRIVGLLVDVNRADAALIDPLIEGSRLDVVDPVLRTAYDRLRRFFVEGGQAGAWRPLDPDLVLFALWGMCKAVAELHLPGVADDPGSRCALLADLVLRGLRPA